MRWAVSYRKIILIGLEEFHTALSLDPLSSIINSNYAVALMDAHRYDESLAQFQKVLAREPAFAPAHFKLSALYGTMGRFGDAVTAIRQVVPKTGPIDPDAKGYLQILKLVPGADNSAILGTAAALAGNRDLAFTYLEKAYSNGDNELLFAVRYPALDTLRSDPRFADLLRRIGLPN